MKRYALFSGYGWIQTKLMHHDCKTKKEAIEYFRDCYPSMMIDDKGRAQSSNVLYRLKIRVVADGRSGTGPRLSR